ncbi:YihY/virulence factor BrkB family protein [Pseudoflavitalea sp. G-6-1-2]|uniref:YihY/virulence factor BrkB family protein n=1 Tax=Pseudoflavitalea sp. G-6-1-2 TaxID=2728841 RepID=UPI00146DDBD5|nr:YihY/virulence factor BrkB family protein [Pseudoflavitalea sp. G-6-1-2]NML22551.1 YihY/virulence factor BrkB family protein [Pseudoflavitalea sp. G-6-1-2]
MKILSCLKLAFKGWDSRMPFASSAVIAYYTIFSLPGLLVVIINIAGYFLGREAVSNQLTTELGGLIGYEAAAYTQNIVAMASRSKGSTLSSIIGIATLLFGATGVFVNVQQIFNNIWEIKPKPKGKFIKLIRDRLLSFGLVLALGFLLLVSLLLSTLLNILSRWIEQHLSETFLVFSTVLDLLLSVATITFLFAAMFKYLPDIKINWKTVLPGALLTSILFEIAKFTLGLYFGKSQPGTTYGAAGSVILIMLWVSYSGLILLFGAEFTRVWSSYTGVKVPPSEVAVKTDAAHATGLGKKEEKKPS